MHITMQNTKLRTSKLALVKKKMQNLQICMAPWKYLSSLLHTTLWTHHAYNFLFKYKLLLRWAPQRLENWQVTNICKQTAQRRPDVISTSLHSILHGITEDNIYITCSRHFLVASSKNPQDSLEREFIMHGPRCIWPIKWLWNYTQKIHYH